MKQGLKLIVITVHKFKKTRMLS